MQFAEDDTTALALAAQHNCECARTWTGNVTHLCGIHRILQDDGRRVAVLVAVRRDARRLITAEHEACGLRDDVLD